MVGWTLCTFLCLFGFIADRKYVFEAMELNAWFLEVLPLFDGIYLFPTDVIFIRVVFCLSSLSLYRICLLFADFKFRNARVQFSNMDRLMGK